MGRLARRAHVAAFIGVVAAGCGDDAGTEARIVPSVRAGPVELPPTQGTASIEPPVLPACLTGDTPTGCHALPELPDCLTDDRTEGCAAPPVHSDWDCPSGWSAETIGEGRRWEHEVCSVTNPASCQPGEIDWLGDDASCEPLGVACPADSFHPEAQIRALAPGFDGDIWYVQPGAAGDGSASSPFGAVQQALDAAGDGDVVALSPDAFAVEIEITKRLAIVGTCTTATRLEGLDGGPPRTVSVQASGVLLANLGVRGPGAGVVVEQGVQDVQLHALHVADTTHAGLLVQPEASATVTSLVVASVAPSSTPGSGWGVAVRGGSLVARRVQVDAAANFGFLVDAGASAEIEDAVVRGTEALQGAGAGVLVHDGAATLTRALLEDNVYSALTTQGPDGALDLDTVLVRGTRALAISNGGAFAVAATAGASASARQLLMTDNEGIGLFADSSLEAQRLLVRDTLTQPHDGAYGIALFLASPADVVLREAVATRARSCALQVQGQQTSLKAWDLVASDTQGSPADQTGGAGLQAYEGPSVTFERAWFENNRYAGMLFLDATDVALTDTVVIDTQLEPGNDMSGFGIWAGGEALLNGERLTVRGASVYGIYTYASEGLNLRDTLVAGVSATQSGYSGDAIHADYTPTTLERLRVRDGALTGLSLAACDAVAQDVWVSGIGSEGDPTHEAAVTAYSGAKIMMDRVRIEDSDTRGIWADGAGTRVVLANTEISRILAVPYEAASSAVLVMNDADLQAETLTVRDTEAAAVQVSWGATSTLTDTLVADTMGDTLTGIGGVAFYVLHGGSISGTRVRLSRNRTAGIYLVNESSTGKLDHLIIDRTAPPQCMTVAFGQEGSCFQSPSEIGNSVSVGVGAKAVLEVSHFDFGHARCGIQIAADGVVVAQHGEVHHNAIGANVRVPDYDLDTLLGPNVRYYANETQIDTKELRLPGLPIE